MISTVSEGARVTGREWRECTVVEAIPLEFKFEKTEERRRRHGMELTGERERESISFSILFSRRPTNDSENPSRSDLTIPYSIHTNDKSFVDLPSFSALSLCIFNIFFTFFLPPQFAVDFNQTVVLSHPHGSEMEEKWAWVELMWNHWGNLETLQHVRVERREAGVSRASWVTSMSHAKKNTQNWISSPLTLRKLLLFLLTQLIHRHGDFCLFGEKK